MRIEVDQISRDVARNHERHRSVHTSNEIWRARAVWLLIGVAIGIILTTIGV